MIAAIESLGIASRGRSARPSAVDVRGDLAGPQVGHRLDVGARGEDPRTAPDHQRTDVVAVGAFGDRRLQLQPHLQVDARSRAAGRASRRDAVVDLESDELRHGADSLPSPRVARRPRPACRGAHRRAASLRPRSGSCIRARRRGRPHRSGDRSGRHRCREVVEGRTAASDRDVNRWSSRRAGIRDQPVGGHASGPSSAHEPASSRSWSSAAARPAPGPSTATGAIGSVADAGHHRRDPARPLDRGREPQAARALTGYSGRPRIRDRWSSRPPRRDPAPAGTDRAASGDAPGTETRRPRRPASFAAASARRTEPWFAPRAPPRRAGSVHRPGGSPCTRARKTSASASASSESTDRDLRAHGRSGSAASGATDHRADLVPAGQQA